MEYNLKTDAKFSEFRKFSYALWRSWHESKPYPMIIGLNSSTADENENDPTITLCINFAKSWGYGGVCVTNLFAFCDLINGSPLVSNTHLIHHKSYTLHNPPHSL